jgi:hypothetical protein
LPRRCPYCGFYIDPGEICDCKKEAAPELEPPEAAQVNDFTESITEENIFVNKRS